MSKDLLSPELRRAEVEIDQAYLSNPLLAAGRATALYHLLMAVDDAIFIPTNVWRVSLQQIRALADATINETRFPLAWIANNTNVQAPGTLEWKREYFDAAYELVSLAKHYEEFAGVFTLASTGVIELSLDGRTIRGRHRLKEGARYEAYNRMFGHPVSDDPVVPLDEIIPRLQPRVKVRGSRFTVAVDDSLFNQARRALTPLIHRRFSLPKTWRFSRYGLDSFERAYGILLTDAMLHAAARSIAASQGCLGLGVEDAIRVRSPDQWRDFVARLGRVPPAEVAAILEDLTYGNRGVRTPDPALQPLVPLDNSRLALSPQYFIHLNTERNLTVLLNRIPAEQAIYSRLVAEKEDLVRSRIIRSTQACGYRSYSGSLGQGGNLPDLDLAIISDRDRACLICELKWFIAPAETRELLQKEEEIAKGVHQVESILEALRRDDPLRRLLGIAEDYELSGAVLSETWVGNTTPQQSSIPVIRTRHLEARLTTAIDLRATIQWLNDRTYLPVEERDFELVTTSQKVAGYELEWFGIKPLSEGLFMTLE